MFKVHHDTGSDMCSIPTQASPFYIGGFGPHSVNSFCGRVHEVRVYERLLTLTELQVVSGATQTELRVSGVLLCYIGLAFVGVVSYYRRNSCPRFDRSSIVFTVFTVIPPSLL